MENHQDRHWIQVALEEARRGAGLTAPNPAVGSVIVRDGIELARGWHRRSGTPHAERNALANLAPGEAGGATAYVTLEPCSTPGRTGACTEALIAAGVSRVVYGARDPNPAHVGGADAVLGAAGIEVKSGVCEEECLHLIRGFAMVQREGRPWVIAKTAMSLDGRITRPEGEGQWLSGPGAREEVQLLRAEVEAIVTSGETVRRDDPALTLRSAAISPDKEQPWRVVLTQAGLDESKYRLFNDEFAERSLLFKNEEIEGVLSQLAFNKGVNTVLLESGGALVGAFLDAGLIDEWVIYLTPMVTGGLSPAVGGRGASSLEERYSLKNLTIHQVGQDLCARGVVDRESPKALVR
ncbi:bifunctional diaminohydroxyphosphoribosylaminopyrimidine deaminase/5-amino-6-(5-phosphoribosylamino)uracil reductase RibD [Verrucomicrobiaceae bacterium 227]